jgi:ABC-type phosphate/phosphonate transport system substrate-binding protein
MIRKIAATLTTLFLVFSFAGIAFAETITCWFPPGWNVKGSQARAITEGLSQGAGLQINPRVAKSYPEILDAFAAGEPALVYVGSFVQTVINARGLGTPLVQSIDGKELYSGVLVYPRGQDPAAILKNFPTEIAYAVGASSGESSAKAATGGQAAIKVPNHGAASGAVLAGKAKAAVVKNSWWEGNKDKFAGLEMYIIPEVSIQGHPDNVLTASKGISADQRTRITAAAIAAKAAFEAPEMKPFDASRLKFTRDLMQKGKIDPLTYTW